MSVFPGQMPSKMHDSITSPKTETFFLLQRKLVEMKLVVDEVYDLTCMEFQREAEHKTSAQLFRPKNNNNIDGQTATTTKENYRDDDSSEAKVQQLLYDHRCFGEEIQAAVQDNDYEGIAKEREERERESDSLLNCALYFNQVTWTCGSTNQSPSYFSWPVSWTRGSITFADSNQENDSDSDSDSDSDIELPGLVERQYHNASSDELYVFCENEQQQLYHTNNDDSSIEDSEGDRDNKIPGL